MITTTDVLRESELTHTDIVRQLGAIKKPGIAILSVAEFSFFCIHMTSIILLNEHSKHLLLLPLYAGLKFDPKLLKMVYYYECIDVRQTSTSCTEAKLAR